MKGYFPNDQSDGLGLQSQCLDFVSKLALVPERPSRQQKDQSVKLLLEW